MRNKDSRLAELDDKRRKAALAAMHSADEKVKWVPGSDPSRYATAWNAAWRETYTTIMKREGASW